MKVRAKISFVGSLNMIKGEIKECSDNATLNDLLECEYVEALEEKEKDKNEELNDLEEVKKNTKKGMKKNESE